MERPSPSHIGPYRLLHLLGSGGMGQVFAAVHENMGRQVALKVLSPASAEDPQRVARFLQEGRALAQFDHPGVVRVFDCDRLDNTAFLAMEHLQGMSLREWMRGHSGPAPLQPALALCRQIADVMVDVHARGVVHRDLKPENVFLCPDPEVVPGFRVKLLDFGIAKLLPDAGTALASTQVHTHEASLIGTYAYMAPEQFRNAATVDGRADVYSLGVLLFELLAGHKPFASDDPVEVMSAHLLEAAPPLKQLVPAVPAALSAFVASMLAKDPSERPPMSRCRDLLGRPWTLTGDECPVPGLAAFTEAQAELFFGRGAETQALLDLLEEARTGGRRWVQLEGAGGVGKSSLIHAGLLPRLSAAHGRGGPRWLVAVLRPSERPLRGLALALASALPGVASDSVEHALREGPDALRTFVLSHVPEGCLLLLVVEPLEELFTLGASECLMVDARLASALTAPDSPLRLLTSLRSDFLPRMEGALPALARQLSGAARYMLLPMEGAALEQVIQGLAWHSGLQLGDGLAARLVADARRESACLPLLGHALRELWALSQGAPLTLAHYEKLGGVGGALARQAEALLEGLGAEGRERARRLLLDLVRVERGVPDTRRPRSRQEVLAAAGGDGLAEEVLLRLSGVRTRDGAGEERGPRLIMLSGEPESSWQRVDLVHEALFQKAPSLVTWLAEARPGLERHSDLEAAAHAWDDARCPEDGLPTGRWLAHYREGADGSPSGRALSSRAARFLLAAERRERQRVRRRWWWGMGSLAAGLAVVLSSLFAWQERGRAEESIRQFVEDTNALVSDEDWKLSRHSDTLELRRRKLQQALMRLSVSERSEPRVREVVIKVQNRLGDVAWHDGTLDEAHTALSKAVEELRAGLEEHPGDGKLLLQLALNHSKLGKVALARGDWAQARTYFTKALAQMERPETQWENEEDRWRTLAVSWSELGDLEMEQGDWAAAEPRYARALALFERNGKPYNDTLHALALCARAKAAWRMRDVQAAAGYFERGLRLARASVQAQPDDQFSRFGLTRSLAELGAFQASQGLSEAAERSFREAEALGRTLRQGESPNKRFALALAQALHGHEALARTRGADGEAARLHEELCGFVSGFLKHDAEDRRFQGFGCQGPQR